MPPTGTRQPTGFHSQALPPSLAPLLRPQALGRWLLPQLSAITPQYLEAVLRGALAGDHVQQWQLFDLMFDTWPELAACAQELTYGVSQLKLAFNAFAQEGEAPTPEALERRKLVSSALRQMRPQIGADENNLDSTIADLVDGWFRGVTCLGLDWQALPLPNPSQATSATAGNQARSNQFRPVLSSRPLRPSRDSKELRAKFAEDARDSLSPEAQTKGNLSQLKAIIYLAHNARRVQASSPP